MSLSSVKIKIKAADHQIWHISLFGVF